MLINKYILKEFWGKKLPCLIVGALVIALFSTSVSASLVSGALDISLHNEKDIQAESLNIKHNSGELTIPVVPANSSTPMSSDFDIAIPLPAALPLMISGIIGLGLFSWKRPKK